MATTDIHAITQTVGAAIAYVTGDKVEGVKKNDIADSINYAMNDKTGDVIYPTMTSVQNCSSFENPTKDFTALAWKFGREELLHGNPKRKDGKPVLAWHLVQSFEGQVDPRIANEIGMKLAKEIFGDFSVVVSTHTNTENTHNHFIICAWDKNGTKWNQCNENYQRIRECSDRLCDAYGLSVLEHTRQQKLSRWEDAEGNVHFYEPTDRKNALLRKREAGEITGDDVGSYRNTMPYEIDTAKKQTNIEIVKQAIDDKLPYATSYEHLLFMLREAGFKVKDKKKNGDWLSHITFTPPTAEKGVRDYTIGEDGYYTRENLTKVIAENNVGREVSWESKAVDDAILHYEEYVYGKIDVQNINEDYRADIAEDGSRKIVRRGEAERSIIRDVKQSDRELYGLYDTTQLDRLIAEQREAKKRGRPAQRREEVLVRQIQEGFENLRFIEQKQLYSFAQINEIVKGLWSQCNACTVEINAAEEMINRLEEAAQAPRVLSEIGKRMEQGKNDPVYMIEQYPQDSKQMRECINLMNKYRLVGGEGMESLQANIAKYRDKVGSLRLALSGLQNELVGYERCVKTLERIEKEQGRGDGGFVQGHRAIVRAAKKEAEQAQKKTRSNRREDH